MRNWAALAAGSLSACCVPAAAVLLCGRFLASRVLSQDAATADAVGAFCAVLSIGLWPAALTLVLQKYLQVRNVVVPVAATSLITFALNACANAFFVTTCGLGTLGSALATTTSRFVNLALLAEYVRRTPSEYEAMLDPDGAKKEARRNARTERRSFERRPRRRTSRRRGMRREIRRRVDAPAPARPPSRRRVRRLARASTRAWSRR